MKQLKRDPVKYIRDLIKKDYILRESCYICGGTETLEVHHLYCLSELYEIWLQKNRLKEPSNLDEMNSMRMRFSEDNKDLLDSKNLFSLCQKHHKELHDVYGKSYAPNLANKVKNWLEIKKEKHCE